MNKQYTTGIVALCLCLSAATARAQYYELPPGAGPYFRMDAGPSFFQNGSVVEPDALVPNHSSVEYRTGLEGSLGFGWAFNRYFEAGAEVGFDGAKIRDVPGYTSDDSYIYNVPFMANATLNLPIPHTIVTPYLGAGVGGADVIFDTDSFENNLSGDFVTGRENDVVFAWQAFAGLKFELAHNLFLGVGYKFLYTDDPSFSYPPDNFHVNFDGARAHTVMATLEFKFW